MTPAGFEPPAQVLAWAREAAEETGGSVLATHSLEEGLSGARAVYTDVWASMGQESEAAERAAKFEKYRVTREVFGDGRSRRDFPALPPRPSRRGGGGAVIDSPASAVFDQAENRLHAQKALLLTLLREAEGTRS